MVDSAAVAADLAAAAADTMVDSAAVAADLAAVAAESAVVSTKLSQPVQEDGKSSITF